MVGRLLPVLLFAVAVTCQAGEPLSIVWPTPNPAYAAGEGPENYIQPTVSGNVESGFFGCVRNSGSRYHEGLDLKPIARDKRGEATDPIYAVMDGVVLYANPVAGNSSYGRYIVIEHQQVVPPVITLYAHLSRIGDAIEPGTPVRAGQTIGIMGRSAGGYSIPKQRAHLHFEIGFWLSEDFQAWYDWKRFGSKNSHGLLNGFNMIGIDALDFYDHYRAGTVTDFRDYLNQLPVAYTVRVKSNRIPDFVRRYPSVVEGAMPVNGPGGWEIDFTSYGLPMRWRALSHSPDQREKARVVFHDPAVVALHACRNAVQLRGGNASVGSHTERSLQLLFGFR